MKNSGFHMLATVGLSCGLFLFVQTASAGVMGGLLTGSSGNVTVSLTSLTFNTDSAAIGGGNSDVSTGTTLSFAGCATGVLGSPGCLSQQEGVTINNSDLTLSAPSLANANTFLTFAAHPNLVFSINWPPGPGSTNTNCAATTGVNGASCSVFAGSPIILTFSNGDTFVGLSVSNASNPAKVSDTGVAGLATSTSTYTGGFSEFLTATLPNGMAPTPQNIQLYFCPDFVTNGNACSAADFNSSRTITSSQSGTFNAVFTNVPEPSSVFLGSLGIVMLLVGTRFRKSHGTRI
jgi:hypothetical protein